jgi:hypothetical protein
MEEVVATVVVLALTKFVFETDEEVDVAFKVPKIVFRLAKLPVLAMEAIASTIVEELKLLCATEGLVCNFCGNGLRYGEPRALLEPDWNCPNPVLRRGRTNGEAGTKGAAGNPVNSCTMARKFDVSVVSTVVGGRLDALDLFFAPRVGALLVVAIGRFSDVTGGCMDADVTRVNNWALLLVQLGTNCLDDGQGESRDERERLGLGFRAKASW